MMNAGWRWTTRVVVLGSLATAAACGQGGVEATGGSAAWQTVAGSGSGAGAAVEASGGVPAAAIEAAAELSGPPEGLFEARYAAGGQEASLGWRFSGSTYQRLVRGTVVEEGAAVWSGVGTSRSVELRPVGGAPAVTLWLVDVSADGFRFEAGPALRFERIADPEPAANEGSQAAPLVPAAGSGAPAEGSDGSGTAVPARPTTPAPIPAPTPAAPVGTGTSIRLDLAPPP